MATPTSLQDLISAVENKAKNTNTDNQTWKLFFNFWKAPVDSVTTVRFLPDADEENPFGFYVENFTHTITINGKRETYPCLKHLYNERCPFCEQSARFYDEKSPDHSRELGKLFYRKKSNIAQILVIESPIDYEQEPLVKLIDFGPQIMDQMQAGWKSGDLENLPHSLKGGYNFRIRKTLNAGGNNSYSTSNYQPKQTDVADDLLAQIKLYDLKQYREPKVDVSVLEAAVLAFKTGETLAPTGSSNTEPVQSVQAPKNTGGSDPFAGMSAVEKLRAQAAARAAMGD